MRQYTVETEKPTCANMPGYCPSSCWLGCNFLDAWVCVARQRLPSATESYENVPLEAKCIVLIDLLRLKNKDIVSDLMLKW